MDLTLSVIGSVVEGFVVALDASEWKLGDIVLRGASRVYLFAFVVETADEADAGEQLFRGIATK